MAPAAWRFESQGLQNLLVDVLVVTHRERYAVEELHELHVFVSESPKRDLPHRLYSDRANYSPSELTDIGWI